MTRTGVSRLGGSIVLPTIRFSQSRAPVKTRCRPTRAEFRPKGPSEPSPGFNLGCLLINASGLKDRLEKRSSRQQMPALRDLLRHHDDLHYDTRSFRLPPVLQTLAPKTQPPGQSLG